jgi:hypothetical protein
MLNLDTKGIVHSRDIKWLNLYQNDWIAKKPPVADHVVDDDDHGIIIPKKPKDIKLSNVSSNTQDGKTQLDARVYRQMKQLESSFNSEASRIVEEFEHGRETLLSYANIAMFTGKIIQEPTNFEEAWKCKGPTHREKW